MGRKRKPGNRERNGKLSRRQADVANRRKVAWDMQAQEAIAPVLEARQRLFGLSTDEARDQRAGSFIGRLCLMGVKDEAEGITLTQYEALCAWEASSRQNSMVIAGPKGDAAMDPNRVQGRGGDEIDGVSARIRQRHMAAVNAVQVKQNELRGTANLFAALYECVQRDRERHHLLGDLRAAANALARHYGLEASRVAA